MDKVSCACFGSAQDFFYGEFYAKIKALKQNP
jgi:hypothetical protein